MGTLCTEEVLRQEAKAVHGADLPGKTGVELYRSLNALNTAALCLSGGGIRSAAFALGVIQCLATYLRLSAPKAENDTSLNNGIDESLLAQFHYLSTVSGGGYIGSWLSAWRARTDYNTVWKYLTSRPNGPDTEPQVISWLRSYSSYLTPKRGVLSADSWTALALYVGNLLLIWLLILPFLCAAVLALKVAAWFLVWFTLSRFWVLELFFALFGVFSLIVALTFATRNRPSRQPETNRSIKPRGATQRQFLCGYLLWSLLSAIALTQFFGSDLAGELFGPDQVPIWPTWTFIGLFAVGGSVIYAIGWLAAWPRAVLGAVKAATYQPRKGNTVSPDRAQVPARADVLDWCSWTVSGLAYGACIGLGFYLFLLVPNDETIPAELQNWFIGNPFMYLLVGIPWCLTSQFVAQIFFSGIVSYNDQADADWEWLARAGGWQLVTGIALFFAILLIFPNFQDSKIAHQLAWFAALGFTSAVLIAVIGKSRFSPGRNENESFLHGTVNGVLAVAAPVFAATLIFVLSTELDKIIFGAAGVELFQKYFPTAKNMQEFYVWQSLIYLVLSMLLCFAIGACASRLLNINRFSLHAIYRNRLIRAFLGASSIQRQADRFIDFDSNDNPRMHTLWPPRKDTGWQPFHVINMTLNMVSAKRLAWQERKAACFTVTPLHSGTGGKMAPRNYGAIGAYRPTIQYGGRGDDPDHSGVSLGTAMAISGAAASPNMGYHSSPAITFLMTMFNVRLGWWLGNPGPEGEDTYFRDGPTVAIVPLLQETFGLTTDDSKYIYLSDGGHFENLGLYEMVRRRCRSIVVVDAGCDPDFRFEDLGNAVRKIAIDLGITVRFRGLDALKKRPRDGSIIGPDCDYHDIGEIFYPEADGGGENGIILYVKPAYHGVESAGIRSFATVNRDFPHQTTADQWFGESRFESYRALGFEIMDSILNKATTNGSRHRDSSLRDILSFLKNDKESVPTRSTGWEGTGQSGGPPHSTSANK